MNTLAIKSFEKRGYDLISNTFFAFEYKENNRDRINITKKITFNTFNDYYKYLRGDIYNQACYFGYRFSENDIKKYHIKNELINYEALIQDKILNYTFESVYDEELNKPSHTTEDIINWINKCKPIDSYDSLMREFKKFKKIFSFFGSEKVYFSLIIQKFGNLATNAIIDYIKNDNFSGVDFYDILFNFGKDESIKIFDCIKTKYGKKSIQRMKKSIELFNTQKSIIIKRGEFDNSSQLFVINYRFFNIENKTSYMYISKYFLTFSDFVKELDGDLSNCDLSKSKLDINIINKYKMNELTKLPISNHYSSYKVIKTFEDNKFVVYQNWFDENDKLIFKKEHYFDFFFDFAFFLNYDISNADLIMCDGIENISKISSLNINGIKVKSSAAKILKLKINEIKKDKYDLSEFETTRNNELITIDAFLDKRVQDDDYTNTISYVTDIHLLHRFQAWECETTEDMIFVMRYIINNFVNDKSHIKLIGGDIASDYNIYKSFITHLRKQEQYNDFFVTLGNHELWSFKDHNLQSTINTYRNLLKENNMYLVHNNLYYYDNGINEITSEELKTISENELRNKLRSAFLIIFGGIGFSGRNEAFNANQNIYRGALDRKQEIKESEYFNNIHNKISKALYDKNVIVFTHMPLKDWSRDNEYTNKFIYVSGHNHRNYYFDDGNKRIYSDNQIGYKIKDVYLKQLSVNFNYDWFSDYKDGIYEITKSDYYNFYRGINEHLSFNWGFKKLYMLKREKIYMFLMLTPKDSLLVLNGGAIKSAGHHTVDYFYENLVNYSQSLKMFLSKYDEFQKNVSKEIKSIGGYGKIHGSIIDIDFYNHLYLNPLDGTITSYYADSITEKYVYNNLPSLLKNRCPAIYNNYEKLFIDNKDNRSVIVSKNNLKISNGVIFVEDTSMYRVSRILKGLQFTTKYNVVRLWNDTIIGDPSEEKGRLIVSGIINPEEIKTIHKEQKLLESKNKPTRNVKIIKEKNNKTKYELYVEKIELLTKNIEVLEYINASSKAKYKCKNCGNIWSTRPDHFKDRQRYCCPKCKK